MTILNRDLFGDEPLLVEHRPDPDRQDRQPEGHAVYRRGQRVEEVALDAVGLVLPRPEQESQQQEQAHDAAEQQPGGDQALRAFLGASAFDRPARFLQDGLDAVHPATKGDQFLGGHRRQLFVGRLISRVLAHDRAPIHSAAAMEATIPMMKIAIPSGAGPKPPRPYPPGLSVSLDERT